MEWSQIERIGKPVVNAARDSSSLLNISIELSRNPSREWKQAFMEAKEACKLSNIHPPSIDGKNIYITPPSDKKELYIKHIDERIAGANKYYKNTILPMLQQNEIRRETEQKHKRNRIENAQSDLNNID